jgi:hypothetical protein
MYSLTCRSTTLIREYTPAVAAVVKFDPKLMYTAADRGLAIG